MVLKEGMSTHSSFLPRESLWTHGWRTWQDTVHGVTESSTTEVTEHTPVLKKWPEVMKKGQGRETQSLGEIQGLRDQKRP